MLALSLQAVTHPISISSTTETVVTKVTLGWQEHPGASCLLSFLWHSEVPGAVAGTEGIMVGETDVFFAPEDLLT